MSTAKKEIRQRFREAVFARDHHKCRICGAEGVELDAHHITPREAMPNGGYVPENGISLCPECHEKAEGYLQAVSEPKVWAPYVPIGWDPLAAFAPHLLYHLIGSSEKKAREASEGLL